MDSSIYQYCQITPQPDYVEFITILFDTASPSLEQFKDWLEAHAMDDSFQSSSA